MSQDDPNLAPIVAHLKQHWNLADVGAMRSTLVTAGHPEPLVDEAIRRLRAANPPRPRAAWPLGLLLMVLNFLLLFAAAVLAQPPVLRDRGGQPQYYLVAVLIYLAQLVAGLRLRGGPRDTLARAMLWGLGLAASVAAVCSLVFLCFALLFYMAWTS